MKKVLSFILFFIILFSILLYIPASAYAGSYHSFSSQSILSMSEDSNIFRLIKGLVAFFLIDRLTNYFPEQGNETHQNNLIRDEEIKEKIDKGDRLNLDENLSDKTIIIDPGHGGSDPGAVGQMGLTEKEVVLDIGINLYNHLKRETDADIFLTRREDVFVPLYRRTNMAHELNADLFISIHINGSERPTKRGIETYADYTASNKNWAFAWYLQDSLVNKLSLQDRGLKTENFHVLRETTRNSSSMKSVLLEIGYITNIEDELFLKNGANRKKAALAIYQGLLNYYSR